MPNTWLWITFEFYWFGWVLEAESQEIPPRVFDIRRLFRVSATLSCFGPKRFSKRGEWTWEGVWQRGGFIHDGARRCTLQLHVCTCTGSCKFRKRRYVAESIRVLKRTTITDRTCRKPFARNPIALTAVRFSPVFVPAEVARPPLKRTAPIVSLGFRVNRKSIRWNIEYIE